MHDSKARCMNPGVQVPCTLDPLDLRCEGGVQDNVWSSYHRRRILFELRCHGWSRTRLGTSAYNLLLLQVMLNTRCFAVGIVLPGSLA